MGQQESRSFTGARFVLELNGIVAGYVQKVSGGTAAGAQKDLLGHELAHVAQQNAQGSSLGKYTPFEYIVLKAGLLKGHDLARWLTPQAVVLEQIDANGRKIGRYALGRFKPARVVKKPAAGGDVAVEVIELAHEGFEK